MASLNRTLLAVACFAALTATIGDLLLLYVGNSMRPELALPPAPPAVLWMGAVLGVAGLPLYVVGYHAIARSYAAGLGSKFIAYPGFVASLGGAGIHALTAFEIQIASASTMPAAAPLEAVAASGSWLVALWLIVGVMFAVASTAFALQWWRTERGCARGLALVNPMLVTILLVVASMSNEWLRSFVAPAAPNAAHVVFFFVLWRIAARPTR